MSGTRLSPLLFHKLETPVFALLFLTALLLGKVKPSTGIGSLVITIFMWGWSTVVWANDVEILEQNMLAIDLPLSRSFWLAFAPHLVCALIGFLIAPKRFLSFRVNEKNHRGEETVSWYLAGQGLFSGQVLTNAALSACSPVVTFVVRAIEPIITANLAIVALGKESTLQQLFPIFLSCSGVVISVLGCEALAPKDLSNIEAACLLAMLSNVGFAVRSCSVKRAFTLEGDQIDPMEVFIRISKTSAVASVVPLVLSCVVWTGHGHGLESARRLLAVTMDCWTPMLSMSLCYALQTAASLLILDAVSVETHSLMSSLKQVFLALLESLLLGEILSSTTLVGVMITMSGLTLYALAPMQLEPRLCCKDEDAASSYLNGSSSETALLLPKISKKKEKQDSEKLQLVPKSLIICCLLVALGGVRCSFGEVGSFKAPMSLQPVAISGSDDAGIDAHASLLHMREDKEPVSMQQAAISSSDDAGVGFWDSKSEEKGPMEVRSLTLHPEVSAAAGPNSKLIRSLRSVT
jgi:drug/metabolite transporter (DMT)-like permease